MTDLFGQTEEKPLFDRQVSVGLTFQTILDRLVGRQNDFELY